MSNHKPYPPTTAGLGLVPTTGVDVAICAVFLVLFLGGAISHMTILQVNLRRGQKFVLSGMIFGFCMARISACVLRIVWSQYPHDVSVAIAAQIFVAAGVVLLFIVNIIFTQRIIRASHPHIGWHKTVSWVFKSFIASIVLVIIMLITSVVQSFYTRNHNTLRIDHDIQRFGATWFAFTAFLPIILLTIRALTPTRGPIENFGSGHMRTKIMILVFSSTILTLGAAFRAGINYIPRPVAHPAWYHSKPCFYLFNFTIEWVVVVLYVVIRVDKRFIVPNGSHGPGDYSRKTGEKVSNVLSEEQISGSEPAREDWEKSDDLEGRGDHKFVESEPALGR